MTTNTSRKPQTTESAKPPVAKLRIGLVNASIWERTTDKGTFHSVTFERRYRDANGEWNSTQSFDAEPLDAGEARRPGAHGNRAPHA